MQVVLHVRSNRPSAIVYDEVISFLDERGIVHGVDPVRIKQQIEDYNKIAREHPGEPLERDLVLAQGTPPEAGEDGRLEILVPEPPPVKFDESGRADFRNVSRFRSVDEGQTLAKLHPPKEGNPGRNVFGDEVKPNPPHVPNVEDGPNVSFVPGSNEYVARVHGIFVQDGDRIDVNPVLIIGNHVGLETGNITYDGNVRIGGNVERSALVSATGDVEIGGAVESGDVRTGGNLNVKKGINTKREGRIHVGGDLQTVYLDNASIEVDGHIVVYKSIITSDVIGYGDVSVTGQGGAISGGELYAFGSVSADVIGNKSGIVTKIYLGDHHKNMRYYQTHLKELEDVEKDLEKLKEKVVRIKQYVQRMRGKIPVDKQAEFRVIYKQYKEQVELRERVNQQVTEFRESSRNHEPVRVVARQTLLPGVQIHYRDSVEKITAPQSRVILKFVPGMEKPQMSAYKPKER